MIELKHLRTLRALSDTGSLQGAADLLCVTQSALSHQIKELEYRLDSSLFERKSQPVHFTDKGQLLLTLAHQVLPQIDAVAARLKPNETQVANLTLCVECHACFHWLLPAVRQFSMQLPQCHIEFVPMIEHNAVESLLQQQLDVVLTPDRRLTDQVHYQYLFDMELRLLVSPEHKLASQTQVTPQQLCHETLFCYPLPAERQDVFRYFLTDIPFRGQLKPVLQGSQILQMVAANQGVAVLPAWMAEPFLQQGLVHSLALGGQGLVRPMYLACRDADAGRDDITQLVQCIRSCSPDR